MRVTKMMMVCSCFEEAREWRRERKYDKSVQRLFSSSLVNVVFFFSCGKFIFRSFLSFARLEMNKGGRGESQGEGMFISEDNVH